ncbi:hypothetical protein HK104_002695 [Borealophlyctis nickersoniae]|nr:hypothetical protein HK104_002695 [Borealophlyctis nickersoniae]
MASAADATLPEELFDPIRSYQLLTETFLQGLHTHTNGIPLALLNMVSPSFPPDKPTAIPPTRQARLDQDRSLQVLCGWLLGSGYLLMAEQLSNAAKAVNHSKHKTRRVQAPPVPRTLGAVREAAPTAAEDRDAKDLPAS